MKVRDKGKPIMINIKAGVVTRDPFRIGVSQLWF